MTEIKRYWNEAMETLNAEEFQKVQEKNLLNQLAYVWANSPFYREKFEAAGLKPEDVKGLDDLKKLPFTEKHEIRESLGASPPLGKHACVGMDKVIRV